MTYIPTSGSGSIANSSDAALSNPVDGQTLIYHADIAKWQNADMPVQFAKVVHGSDHSINRPNAQYVLWEGSVEPAHWINGDDWNQTA